MDEHDTQSTEVVSFRADRPLAKRLDNLRENHDLNVSAYLRRVILAALDRDYPLDHQ